MEQNQSNSKASLWTGGILKGLVSTFLLFDAAMKVIKHQRSIEGTEQLGLNESSVQPLGIYLLLATLLYIVPRTTVIGGLFLTAYLGGAAAITYSANINGHSFIFPIVFAIVMWMAEYLRNVKIRTSLPIIK